jgi:hypothetical protein
VAESDGITGLSLNGVRKLIENKNLPEDLLDAFNLISGAVIALSPLALGPAGAAALWPLLEPKNDLIDAAKTAIRKLTKSQPRDYVDQARRLAAANTLLTYAAFFDALSICKPDFLLELTLSEKEKARITALAADQVPGPLSRPASEEPVLTEIIKVPHPVAANDIAATEFRRMLYRRMATQTYLESTSQAVPDRHRKALSVALRDRVAALAESVYQAEFLGLAIDYQPFSTWATLHDQADKARCCASSATTCASKAKTATFASKCSMRPFTISTAASTASGASPVPPGPARPEVPRTPESAPPSPPPPPALGLRKVIPRV